MAWLILILSGLCEAVTALTLLFLAMIVGGIMGLKNVG